MIIIRRRIERMILDERRENDTKIVDEKEKKNKPKKKKANDTGKRTDNVAFVYLRTEQVKIPPPYYVLSYINKP